MKRIRFTEEQVIAVLREREVGAKTADPAREHGISEAMLYKWKANYGGLDMSDAKRLRALEDPHAEAAGGLDPGPGRPEGVRDRSCYGSTPPGNKFLIA